MIRAERPPYFQSPNETVRLAVVGLGSTTAVGGVGGRGHQLIPRLEEIPGAKIVALCDVDQAHLDREVQPFKDRGEKVATHTDLRKVFDDKTIDAVVIALPNHWHALATIWACQSGKDVYVEKPFSYNFWEGRQMVAAARKHGRMVQVGTQSRSSPLLHQAFEFLRDGHLGTIRYAHALVYRAREGIGTVNAPRRRHGLSITISGAVRPPRHRSCASNCTTSGTGSGPRATVRSVITGSMSSTFAAGLWGKTSHLPALSIGGRFGFNDSGETANTQIALLDYQPAPLICEIRNVSVAKSAAPMGKFRNQNHGVIIACEGGYFAGDSNGGTVYDNSGKKIKNFTDGISPQALETLHLSSFIAAVRSRKSSNLPAEALQGHLSAACCHMANLSHRLGKQAPPDSIHATIEGNSELTDSFDRCRDYLRENGVDLAATPATLGPWITFDPKEERFDGEFGDAANKLSRRQYREPFVVPEIT